MKLDILGLYYPKGMRLYKSLHVRLLSLDDKKAKIIPCDAVADEKNVQELDIEDFKGGFEEFKT